MSEVVRNAAGIVLCGGRSSRMRRPKALLPWGSVTMLEHVVATLREVVDDVVVVSSADLVLPALDARVVVDREPGLGPLGGIREGLHAVDAELALATSTDVPFSTASFARFLLAQGQMVACRVADRIQPLPAVYSPALAATADDLLAAGRMRPLFLLEAGGYRCLEENEVEDVEVFRGINTPQEYLAALAAAGETGRVDVELRGTAAEVLGHAHLDASPGTLADVLGGLELGSGTHRVTIDGTPYPEDPMLPVGPNEHVVIEDA